jgi:hypothetical protein
MPKKTSKKNEEKLKIYLAKQTENDTKANTNQATNTSGKP